MFVAINAIEVPAERAEDFAERFAKRGGMVDQAPGFVRFELLRPAGGGTRWLVATHWESEQAFEDWAASPAFSKGHAQQRKEGDDRGSAGTSSELWRFEVVQNSG